MAPTYHVHPVEIGIEIAVKNSIKSEFFNKTRLAFRTHIGFGLWQADASDDGSRHDDYGAAFSAAWLAQNKWLPFLRTGASKGTNALYDRSVSIGLGYYGRNADGAGIGLN